MRRLVEVYNKYSRKEKIMKLEREVTIRQIIKELNEPVKLTEEDLLKRIQKGSARLQSLEVRIMTALDFLEQSGSELDKGKIIALGKILGEKE